ncbi:MAG: TRAM domain-containing protein [Candidatus Micrarchaeota archaeon]|nr:TRAM domain-containing protein [Candidatus Micrarchaeota archaeon]
MYQDEGSGRNSSYGGGYGGRREGRRSSFSGSSEPKPVNTGDEIEVKIEAVASKGDGIAKKDGFVIFIKGAKEGETVKARITEVKERFAIGEVIS